MAGEPVDLRPLLAPRASSTVELSTPATPVLLPQNYADELAAAVGAALDNVRHHAGAVGPGLGAGRGRARTRWS